MEESCKPRTHCNVIAFAPDLHIWIIYLLSFYQCVSLTRRAFIASASRVPRYATRCHVLASEPGMFEWLMPLRYAPRHSRCAHIFLSFSSTPSTICYLPFNHYTCALLHLTFNIRSMCENCPMRTYFHSATLPLASASLQRAMPHSTHRALEHCLALAELHVH